ncbi:PspA/IM30 family protein [Clostridium brassicae]|uniref:PspA/IM30 family protein n=1 Tax=Clostridium brassicae TaxID=2999072 RepID=A0ABT4D618_9CLOT|nr:PspA/IM30 family protein [Clostridium brassicae]MCY6957740.1 PspA/IM30 family protein [Clostridium brassicae]
MGIFQRMSNIIKAKTNDALDRIENPIELLDQKIRDMEESFNKAKLASAQVLGNIHETKLKLDKLKTEMDDFEAKIKLALSKGNEELAKKALERKLTTQKEYDILEKSYEKSKIQGEELKKKLSNLQKESENTRKYRDQAEARMNNAEATQKVNEMLSNVSTESNRINLDDIERKISKKEALAEGLGELSFDDSLDKEFEQLETFDLDAELAKYKQQ